MKKGFTTGRMDIPVGRILGRSGSYPHLVVVSPGKLLGGQGTQAKDNLLQNTRQHIFLTITPFLFLTCLLGPTLTRDAREERTRLGSCIVSRLTAAN